MNLFLEKIIGKSFIIFIYTYLLFINACFLWFDVVAKIINKLEVINMLAPITASDPGFSYAIILLFLLVSIPILTLSIVVCALSSFLFLAINIFKNQYLLKEKINAISLKFISFFERVFDFKNKPLFAFFWLIEFAIIIYASTGDIIKLAFPYVFS